MNAIIEKVIERDTSTAVAALTPMDMIERAISKGVGVDVIEKLMGLQERWEANQARKAFDAAMAAASAEIPVISKNRTVDFTSPKGRTRYQHEDFAQITRAIDPILSKYGLSYRYRTSSESDKVTVTCVVAHRDGHSQENSLSGPPDQTGNKNALQAIGSTVTLLQRYTLKSAFGLAVSDDDDGNAAGTDEKISDEQAATITALVQETKSDVTRFLKWANAESISDIPAAKFNNAVAMLEAKKQGTKS
jgi:hypothetical protein